MRMTRARNADAVCMHLIEGFVGLLRARNVHVVMCGVRAELFDSFERTGLAARMHPDHLFREQPLRLSSTQQAVRYAYGLVTEPCSTCPRQHAAGKDGELYFVV